MAGRRVVDFRFPTEKQARSEETARRLRDAAAPPPTPAVGPADPMPDSYWDAVLTDPRATAGARRKAPPATPLRDIGEHVLRVECDTHQGSSG